ncbi:MAG: TIM barrel protein [Clostridia bacterium]|nr:TIM barrel protein [Clostridia bacterium]
MDNLGLVSISFRNLSIEEIINLCRKNGLKNIEWGGDVHVPHGDIETAKAVFEECEQAGIKTAAYGSYYRVCPKKTVNPKWSAVVDTAAALHATVIRVWICEQGSAETDEKEFNAAVEELKEMCGIAAKKGIIVCAECHPFTLTDDYVYSVRLAKAVNLPNFKLYWQPNQFKDLQYNLSSIDAMKEYIINVHTFYWEENKKLSLSEGREIWQMYLKRLGNTPKCFLFEFMPNDSPEELPEEIKIFNSFN